MQIKKINTRKIPYYLILTLLTIGASLILGFLSFGGIYVYVPLIPLAATAFGLSVFYEAEIYLQNIKNSLKKLFGYTDYVQQHLANEFLLEHFPRGCDLHLLSELPTDTAQYKNSYLYIKKNNTQELYYIKPDGTHEKVKIVDFNLFETKINVIKDKGKTKTKLHLNEQQIKEIVTANGDHTPADLNELDCPQFFKDYANQLKLLNKFGHHALNSASQERRKRAEKKLRAMEKWFAAQLTSTENNLENLSEYQLELKNWLNQHQEEHVAWQDKLAKRRKIMIGLQIFSTLSAFAMSIGTVYLLSEQFAAVAFLAAIPAAALPGIIIPAALIAGIAYGMLTYNAITDMVNNETIQKWWQKTKDSYYHESGYKFGLKAVSAILLIGLAATLTFCTAGTWWTIAKNARPIYEGVVRTPGFIIGIVVPVFTGLASLVFTAQNTFETLDMLEQDKAEDQKNIEEKSFWRRTYNRLAESFNNLKKRENNWQIISPFRIFLKLTFFPLRVLLFLGHLLSIGATADRVPGVPVILSIIMSMLSEGFEDASYFFQPEHSHSHSGTLEDMLKERLAEKHSHSHDNDIPTKLLRLIFWPIHQLAIRWDMYFSQRNENPDLVLNYEKARFKHTGQEVEKNKDPKAPAPISDLWEFEDNIAKIEKYKHKHLTPSWLSTEQSTKIAVDKAGQLTHLQASLKTLAKNKSSQKGHACERIKEEIDKDIKLNADIYSRHRFWNNGKTATEEFLTEKLSGALSENTARAV